MELKNHQPAGRPVALAAGHIDPVRINDRVLLTCRGIAIGGAYAATSRAPVTQHRLSLVAAPMSSDAMRIQSALLDKRTESKRERSLFERFVDATVRPLYSLC